MAGVRPEVAFGSTIPIGDVVTMSGAELSRFEYTTHNVVNPYATIHAPPFDRAGCFLQVES